MAPTPGPQSTPPPSSSPTAVTLETASPSTADGNATRTITSSRRLFTLKATNSEGVSVQSKSLGVEVEVADTDPPPVEIQLSRSSWTKRRGLSIVCAPRSTAPSTSGQRITLKATTTNADLRHPAARLRPAHQPFPLDADGSRPDQLQAATRRSPTRSDSPTATHKQPALHQDRLRCNAPSPAPYVEPHRIGRRASVAARLYVAAAGAAATVTSTSPRSPASATVGRRRSGASITVSPHVEQDLHHHRLPGRHEQDRYHRPTPSPSPSRHGSSTSTGACCSPPHPDEVTIVFTYWIKQNNTSRDPFYAASW